MDAEDLPCSHAGPAPREAPGASPASPFESNKRINAITQVE